jgi:hypothetical protein
MTTITADQHDANQSARTPATRGATAIWTAAGFVLYIVGGFASLLALALFQSVVLEPFGLRPQAGTFDLSLRNGIHAIVWGLLVAALAAPLGRRLVPGIRFGQAGWLVLAGGLVIAAVATTLGEEFVRARYIYYDAEYQGLTVFTGPALVAVALATWAALAVPPSWVLLPAAAALTAAAGLALSLLPSIPGAGDGIEAGSLPLVAAFAAGVAYAIMAVVLVVRHAMKPRAEQRAP